MDNSDNHGVDKDTEAAVAVSNVDSTRKNLISDSDPSDVVDLTEDYHGNAPGSRTEIPISIGILDSPLSRAVNSQLQNQSSVLSDGSASPCGSVQGQGEPKALGRLSNAQASGIPGIDRKRLEEERLARLANKRKATEMSDLEVVRQAKASRSASPTRGTGARPTSSGNLSKPSIASSQKSTENSTQLQFPTGVVKKTWAFGCERENDIKLEEVIQKKDLELAVLSSFQWDMEWLFRKFETEKTRFLFIMQAKDDLMKRAIKEDTKDLPNVRVCFPSMEGQVNCMHSKLMLLFHPEYLRVVVPSANLVPYDWGEIGTMENVVFLIDLPRKPTNSDDNRSTAFYDELCYFLNASSVHENIIGKLSGFDFRETKDIAFVHTIGGSHSGVDWKRTGICGLGKAVSSLGLRTSQPLQLDYVASSIGSLTDNFMRGIYLAAQGDSGLKELIFRSSKGSASSKWGVSVQGNEGSEWKERFRVYFPSLETVRHSNCGVQGAGTICFQPRWYTSPAFPQHVMRDSVSCRNGILMHNKMLFVCPDQPINGPDGRDCSGWAYIGSANLSESAWGRLVAERGSSRPKLNCRNWECGVIIPIRKMSPVNDNNATNLIDLTTSPRPTTGESLSTVFEGSVPVPMRLPAPKYKDGNRPFYYMEDR